MPDAVTHREILQHHTGGGFLLTRQVSQRIGVVFSVRGVRRGWRPAAITLSSLAVSLVTSALVASLGSGLAGGAAALVGWQLAYGLDCADGQLARAAGRTSASGGALDLYADWLGRVGIIAALLGATSSEVVVPGWMVALLVAGLLAGIFHQAMEDHHVTVEGIGHRAREFVGIVRDPTFLLLAYAAGVAAGPTWVVVAMTLGATLGAVQFLVRATRITASAWQA